MLGVFEGIKNCKKEKNQPELGKRVSRRLTEGHNNF